jgi:hypothetical protein
MLFFIAGIVTVFTIARYRQTNWFVAIFGISLCMAALNMVYLVSAMPSSSLNQLFYMETEDNSIYYVPSDYAWFAILIGVIVCFIG